MLRWLFTTQSHSFRTLKIESSNCMIYCKFWSLTAHSYNLLSIYGKQKIYFCDLKRIENHADVLMVRNDDRMWLSLSLEKLRLIASKKYRASQVHAMSCNIPILHLLIELLKRLIQNSTINQMFTSEAVGSKRHMFCTLQRGFHTSVESLEECSSCFGCW